MNAKPKRSDRVGESVRSELTAMLARGAIRDPAVQDAIITTVRLSDDLRNARVYVRLLAPEVSQGTRDALLQGLQRAAPYIRRSLAPTLKLKYQPDLKFFWDEGLDRAARVEALLHDLREEEAQQRERGDGEEQA